MTGYEQKKARLLAELAAAPRVGFGLTKETSNLFRDRAPRERERVDLKHFNQVLRVDATAGLVEADGRAQNAHGVGLGGVARSS